MSFSRRSFQFWRSPLGSPVFDEPLGTIQTIVELDTSSYQDRLDQQILGTDAARAAQIKAKAKYDNQITQNKTTEQNATLAVRL